MLIPSSWPTSAIAPTLDIRSNSSPVGSVMIVLCAQTVSLSAESCRRKFNMLSALQLGLWDKYKFIVK